MAFQSLMRVVRWAIAQSKAVGFRNHAIGMKTVLRGKERGRSQFFRKDGLIDHLLVELGDGAGAIGIMVLDGKQRELQGGLPDL